MSTKLFRYRDLVRIHRAVSPGTAPGAAGVEALEIALLIGDLLVDFVEAAFEAESKLPGAAIRDLVARLARGIQEITNRAGMKAIDFLRDLIPEEENSSGQS